MSSTILMVIVLVVMWLVVLVPMFVRRHDEVTEERSVDRFTTAMRVLARRSYPPPGSASRPAGRHGPPRTPYRLGSPTALHIRAEAHRRMIARRRRTLSLLVLLSTGSLIGAATVSAWLWAAAVLVLLLLAGYVVWLRQEVRRQHARWQRRAAVFSRAAPSRRPHTVRLARPPAASRRGALIDGYRPARHPASADPAAPADGTDVDRTWQPAPVPPPTYVTKPAAHRPAPATAVELDDDDPTFAEIDDLVPPVEHPRVVNG